MRSLRRSHVLIAAWGMAASSCAAPPDEQPEDGTPSADIAAPQATRAFRMEGSSIVTDTFTVNYDLRDGRLVLVLTSDLSDDTKLMVGASRTYQERGSSETYVLHYFSESSTIGAWRQARTIILDNEKWKSELDQRQRALAASGLPFTVSRISENVDVSLTVPVNQEPPFQQFNANLTGGVVTTSGNLRIVAFEEAVPYPIDAAGVGQAQYGDPLNLTVGAKYTVSRATPIMPESNPSDPIAAIAGLVTLSAGEAFTVLERAAIRGAPWYRVRAGATEGWINSTALIGQQLDEG